MSSRWLLILLLGILYGPSQIQGQCTNTSLISSGLDAMLAEYNREEPPGKPVNVTISLDLRHATLTDQGYLRILADLHLRWNDSRLSWNATEWRCNKTVVSSERVWTPDVELISGGDSRGEGLRARLSSEGEVAWPRRLDLAVPAKGNVYNWPSDTYIALFNFASREHDLNEIFLTAGYDEKWATIVATNAWEVAGAYQDTSKVDAGWGEVRAAVGWWLQVRRCAKAAAVAAQVGAVAAGALLATSGALPARDRAALHVAAALIATVCLFWSASNSSLLSSGVPLVTRLSAALCVAAGAAALGAAVVTRIARRGATPPQCLRAVLTRASRFCTLATSPNGESCEASWSAAAQLLDYIIQAALWLLLIVIACLMI